MIQPGLERISRLVNASSFPWRAIHVAGTNGKGSVCAYASAMLTASKIKTGRFTSPHLVHRWDCVTIDGRADKDLFAQCEDIVQRKNRHASAEASEFELLTATAFEVFNQAKVQVAVVEVGMGGRFDATNVIQRPLATVVTKISRDHEAFLGSSLEAIAGHKAGIIKAGSPCIVDGTNAPEVIDVLRDNVQAAQASSLTLIPQHLTLDASNSLWRKLGDPPLLDHQRTNLALAHEATSQAMTGLNLQLHEDCLRGLHLKGFPGRLEMIDLSTFANIGRPVLLDGAHNESSAEVLASYVDRNLRPVSSPITWVLGFSKGKDIESILRCLLRPGDHVVTSGFDAVSGMPWVEPAPAADILDALKRLRSPSGVPLSADRISDAIPLAANMASGGQIVIAGSLYLVSDTLARQDQMRSQTYHSGHLGLRSTA